MMTNGIKLDTHKPRFSLVPDGFVWRLVDVLEYGASKYPQPDNWKRVDDASTRYFDALMRHVAAWRRGEEVDGESGLPHLAHASACLSFLMWFDDQAKAKDAPHDPPFGRVSPEREEVSRQRLDSAFRRHVSKEL